MGDHWSLSCTSRCHLVPFKTNVSLGPQGFSRGPGPSGPRSSTMVITCKQMARSRAKKQHSTDIQYIVYLHKCQWSKRTLSHMICERRIETTIHLDLSFPVLNFGVTITINGIVYRISTLIVKRFFRSIKFSDRPWRSWKRVFRKKRVWILTFPWSPKAHPCAEPHFWCISHEKLRLTFSCGRQEEPSKTNTMSSEWPTHAYGETKSLIG